MTKRLSRKNRNRPPKPHRHPARPRTPLPELPTSAYLRRKQGGTLTLTATAYEDSVLPVPLKFDAPLPHLASDPTGFNHQWQLLTYAFDFDDPGDFPSFETMLPPEDLRSLRFITVAQTVTLYTLVSHKGGFTVKINNGEATHKTVVADDQVIAGFSVPIATPLLVR